MGFEGSSSPKLGLCRLGGTGYAPLDVVMVVGGGG